MWGTGAAGWGRRYLIEAFGLNDFDFRDNSVMVFSMPTAIVGDHHTSRMLQYIYKTNRSAVCVIELEMDWNTRKDGTDSVIRADLVDCHETKWPN